MRDYDYPLPEEAIAQEPVEPRSAARLLDGRTEPPGHRTVADLPDLLEPGDLLVVNDTRVLPARLHLRKATGGAVEVLLLEVLGGEGDRWAALVRPGRRVPPGTTLLAGDRPVAEVGEPLDDSGRRAVTLLEPPARHGTVALPPYIHTPLADPERYQTVYARTPGSVAAPTAGLHLTPEVLAACAERGVGLATVDLAVGLDTFRPVTVDDPDQHEMHSERYEVPASTLEACRRANRVVAVGTTAVRALESAAASGELAGRTRLFIRPGYRFQVVDLLLTNFHLPRSTLLLLLAAFHGPRWRHLYDVALADGYRFLSFGDCMLVPCRQRAS